MQEYLQSPYRIAAQTQLQQLHVHKNKTVYKTGLVTSVKNNSS